MNMSNFGLATGRLTQDVKTFPVNENYVKMKFTLAVDDNFRRANGEKATQFLPFERLMKKDEHPFPFDRMFSGDKVSVNYSVRNNDYTDKAGVKHYDLVLIADQVTLCESKAVTDRRRKQHQAQEEAMNLAMNGVAVSPEEITPAEPKTSEPEIPAEEPAEASAPVPKKRGRTRTRKTTKAKVS